MRGRVGGGGPSLLVSVFLRAWCYSSSRLFFFCRVICISFLLLLHYTFFAFRKDRRRRKTRRQASTQKKRRGHINPSQRDKLPPHMLATAARSLTNFAKKKLFSSVSLSRDFFVRKCSRGVYHPLWGLSNFTTVDFFSIFHAVRYATAAATCVENRGERNCVTSPPSSGRIYAATASAPPPPPFAAWEHCHEGRAAVPRLRECGFIKKR